MGIEAFTIRKLAGAIGVKPMTIYYHLPNKEAIVEGMVNGVFKEIDLPLSDLDWRSAIQVRSMSMRSVLAAHPWAAPLTDSRATPGMDTLRHHDAALDSFLSGFAFQEATLPGAGAEEITDLEPVTTEQTSDDPFPHLREFAAEHVMQPGYDFGKEFDVGLSIIFDGLERMAETAS